MGLFIAWSKFYSRASLVLVIMEACFKVALVSLGSLVPCSLNAAPVNKSPKGKNRGVLCEKVTAGRGKKGRRRRGGGDMSVLLMELLFSPETEGQTGRLSLSRRDRC